MRQRFSRKVLGATPFFAMNNRPCYRLALECGHTVARAEVSPEARCEECRDEAARTQNTPDSQRGE